MTLPAAVLAAGALLAAGCGSGSDDSGSSAADMAEHARASVVSLTGVIGDDQFAGSGFVWDAHRGLVITNAHVTWGASELLARLGDGTEVRGEIAAQAPCDDIAAIILDPVPPSLETAEFASAKDVKAGDEVSALGYTPGTGHESKVAVTRGPVAVANFGGHIDPHLPELPSLVEHQAPLTPSQSGGELVNADGKVIAMNSIVGHADEAHAEPPFYAITVDRIKQRLGQLRRSSSGRYVGWNDAHACHRPLERLARTLHHGYKSEEEMNPVMHDGAMEAEPGHHGESEHGGEPEHEGGGSHGGE